MHNTHLLLGAVCSRYSARVRSYLIKKGIQYVERVPSAWTFRVSIVRRFGDAAVPVLITPEGEWLADSTLILDHLEARFPEGPILPADPVHALFATLADIWASEFWQPVDLYTRWSRPENYPWWREELGEGFMAGFPKFLKNAAADRMASVLHAHLPRVGATAEYGPLVMRWAGRHMDALERHFAQQPYLLGERATRFDFGLIAPFFGHIVQDRTSRNELLMPRPHLHAWVWRMNQPYLTREAPALPVTGAPLPPTLQPVIRSMFDEMLPYIESTLTRLRHAAPARSSGTRIPRFLGTVSVPFGDGELRREAMAFTLWLTQRALDLVAAMPAADAARARLWLDNCGGGRLLELDIPRLAVSGLTVRFA
jgi:glutathione S-transferase